MNGMRLFNVVGMDDLEGTVFARCTCEVHDENGDIIFSQWDRQNSDYPNIKNIWFPVADMEMIRK